MKNLSRKVKRFTVQKKPHRPLFRKNNFVQFVNRYALDIFFLFISIVLAGYAWRRLSKIVIRSDGFVHMLQSEQERFWGQDYWITGLELDASILGAILPKFFGPNVASYLWFEWVVILLIVLVFYLLVRVITKSSVIAFTATLISSISYLGNWDMYGTHCYCFFIERVTNIPFLLVSFLFLHLYLVKSKRHYLLVSFLLYFVGLGLGHLALLLTPPFVLYPFWWFVVQSWKKETWKGVLIGGIFLLISIGITLAQRVTYDNWGPKWTFTEFAFNPSKYDYLGAMAFQLTNWSQYYSISPNLYTENPLRDIDLQHINSGISYVLFIYLITFVVLYKKLPTFRALLLTCFFGVIGILFLNSYVRLPEIIIPDSNRYLYYPTFFLSIFWGVSLWHFFLNRKGFLRIMGVLIIIFYCHVNVVLLEHIIDRNIEWNRSTKALFDYVLQTRNSLSPNTLVVVEYPEFWVQEADFFTEQLGRGEVEYETAETNMGDWRRKIPKYQNILQLEYNTSCDCVKETKIK